MRLAQRMISNYILIPLSQSRDLGVIFSKQVRLNHTLSQTPLLCLGAIPPRAGLGLGCIGYTRSLKYTTGRTLLAMRGRFSTSLCWVLSVMSQIRVRSRLGVEQSPSGGGIRPCPSWVRGFLLIFGRCSGVAPRSSSWSAVVASRLCRHVPEGDTPAGRFTCLLYAHRLTPLSLFVCTL